MTMNCIRCNRDYEAVQRALDVLSLHPLTREADEAYSIIYQWIEEAWVKLNDEDD